MAATAEGRVGRAERARGGEWRIRDNRGLGCLMARWRPTIVTSRRGERGGGGGRGGGWKHRGERDGRGGVAAEQDRDTVRFIYIAHVYIGIYVVYIFISI